MTKHNLDHQKFLSPVAAEDVRFTIEKDTSYDASWKLRGGVGAFMMMARKWDRLESILKGQWKYDIFTAIEQQTASEKDLANSRTPAGHPVHFAPGGDGTVLAEIRDLRRYLALAEAEMMSRGVVPTPVGAAEHDVKWESTKDPTPRKEHYVSPEIKSYVLDRVGVRMVTGDWCEWQASVNSNVYMAKVVGILPYDEVDIDMGHMGVLAVKASSTRRMQPQPHPDSISHEIPPAPVIKTNPNGSIVIEPKHQRTLAPWVCHAEYFKLNDVPVEMRQKFWKHYAAGMHVLEPHAYSDDIPNCLRDFYHRMMNNDWILKISECPADVREHFPNLLMELNSKEHDELPAWQRGLYSWSGEKFMLIATNWHVEAE